MPEAAEFLADTVIQFNRDRQGRRSHRSIEILKSRGQDFETGAHSLRITAETGLQVGGRSATGTAGPDYP
jgi:circadian clock protein KaiC